MAKEVFDFYVREGTTDPITVELQDIDSDTKERTPASIIDWAEVTWKMKPRDGSTLLTFDTGTGGKVSVVNAVIGQVRLSPDEDDWVMSHKGYTMWIVVTDGTGKLIDYPSERDVRVGMLDNS